MLALYGLFAPGCVRGGVFVLCVFLFPFFALCFVAVGTSIEMLGLEGIRRRVLTIFSFLRDMPPDAQVLHARLLPKPL